MEWNSYKHFEPVKRKAEHAWQIEVIETGIREADAGNFATDAETRSVFAKWGVDCENDSMSPP
jgi:predicted transcriptional regulator